MLVTTCLAQTAFMIMYLLSQTHLPNGATAVCTDRYGNKAGSNRAAAATAGSAARAFELVRILCCSRDRIYRKDTL